MEVLIRVPGPTLLRRHVAALRCPWCGHTGIRSVNTRRCSWWITRRAWVRIRAHVGEEAARAPRCSHPRDAHPGSAGALAGRVSQDATH